MPGTESPDGITHPPAAEAAASQRPSHPGASIGPEHSTSHQLEAAAPPHATKPELESPVAADTNQPALVSYGKNPLSPSSLDASEAHSSSESEDLSTVENLRYDESEEAGVYHDQGKFSNDGSKQRRKRDAFVGGDEPRSRGFSSTDSLLLEPRSSSEDSAIDELDDLSDPVSPPRSPRLDEEELAPRQPSPPAGSASAGAGGESRLPDLADKPLAEAFREALRKAQQLEQSSLHPRTAEFKQLHAETLRRLLQCAAEVERAGVFSPNEQFADVKTSEIPYFNLNFYIAKVLERSPIDPSATSVDARAAIVHLAARKYLEFLALLEDYGAVADKAINAGLHKALPEGVKGRFNLGALHHSKNFDREAKIENFRLMQSMERDYEQIRRAMKETGTQDEESMRRAESLRIRMHQYQAFDATLDIFDELVLLSSMSTEYAVAPLQERDLPYVEPGRLNAYIEQRIQRAAGATFDDARQDRDNRAREEKTNAQLRSTRVDTEIPRPNRSQRLTGPKGEVRRPFVVMPAGYKGGSTRAEVMANVFGTGQRLPTISIDELVKKELENSLDGKPRPAESELLDEDSDAVVDAATMKARLWDEFTESVARGSGNTLNLG